MRFAVRSVVRASFAGGLLALLLLDGTGSGRAQGPSWWDRAFGYRQRVTVTATVGVPGEYAVSISFNHAALVSAGKSQTDGDDVRVVRWDGTSWTELDRVLDEFSTWSSSSTEVWFKTRATIAAGASDSSYYLHYGNAVAERPPADRSRVFDLWDDFNDTKNWTTFVDDGDRSSQQVGLQTDGKTVTVIPNGRLMSGIQHKTYSPGYTYGFAARLRAKSVGAVTDELAACWFINAPSGETNCFETQGHKNHYVRELGKSANAGSEATIDEDQTTGPFPAANVWYTYEVEHLANGRIRVEQDGRQQFPPTPGSFSKPDTTLSSGGFGVGGEARSGECYQFDWIWARKRVDPEPGTTLGMEETPEPPPPPPPVSGWWNTCYTFRCRATVRTSGSAITAGHTVGITVDTAALIAAGKLRADGKDLRVVYWNGTSFVELDRHITVGTFNTATTLVWFKAQAPIPAKSGDSNYFVHYGCSSPGEPPQDLTKVYNPPKDADTQVLWYAKDSTGRRLTDSSGRGRNRTLPSGWEWSADSKFGTGFTTPLEETSKDGTGKRIGSGFSPNIDTEDWTVEGWVKITEQTPLYTDMVLWHTWRWGGFVMGTFGASEGQIFVSLNEIRDSVTTRKSLNRFHHFAASYDAANDKLYFYKDGLRVGQKSGLVSDTWGPTAFQIFYGGDGWSDFTYGALQEGIRVSSVRRESFPYVVAEEPVVLCGGEERFVPPDVTPPVITLNAPAEGSFVNVPPVVTFTATDEHLLFVRGTLDGQPFTSGGVVTGEGPHTIFVEAEDEAGNRAEATRHFTLDTVAPSIVVTPPAGTCTSTDVVPTVTITDPNLDPATVVITLNGAPFVSGTPVTAEGAYVLVATAADRAGNQATASTSFTIDKTRPVISITGVTDGQLSRGPVTPVVTVTDANLTATTITLNGAPFVSGTEIRDDGNYTLRVEASDCAGNTSNQTVVFAIDGTAPLIDIESPADGFRTSEAQITVSGTVSDANLDRVDVNGIVAVVTGNAFRAAGVPLVEGPNLIRATAVDRAGNTGTDSITVTRETIPLTLTLVGPSFAQPNQRVTVTGEASPQVVAVQFAVDGVPAPPPPEDTSRPFEHTFNVPRRPGGTVTVTATGRDGTGRTVDAAPLTIQILKIGFLTGEAYDDSKGLPLPGVSVAHEGGGTATTNMLGRFGLPSEDDNALLRFTRDGYTPVERVTAVDPEKGTLVLDARLTPLNPETKTLDDQGGSVKSQRSAFELTVPSGALSGATPVRLTEVSVHGLRAPLPLGWSSVGGVQIDSDGMSFAVPAELKLVSSEATGVILARYDLDLHTWVAGEPVTVGNQSTSALINKGGAYAFVVPDADPTAPEGALTPGEPLPAADAIEARFGLQATSSVTPPVSPVSVDARATGNVVLSSLVSLPSGTIVSARVEETFQSLEEGELRPEPFAQELGVYRQPAREDGKLQAFFPVTPSRAFTVEELREGRVHVEIHPSPDFERGALVGPQAQIVKGGGGVELGIPAGALDGTTAVFTETVDRSTVNVAPSGLTLQAAVDIDLSGARLGLPGTLSLPAPVDLTAESLFVARFLFVRGQRKLELIGTARLESGRLSAGGVDLGARYLFFKSDVPLAVVDGLVREGAAPARLVAVESSTAPFADVTEGDGRYRVAAALRQTTIAARSLESGNTGSEVVTPGTTDAVEAPPIELAATGPFVSAVTPADASRGVLLSPAISVTFSEPVVPSTVTTASFRVLGPGSASVDGRIAMGVGNRSASFLPTSALKSLTEYQILLANTITDGTGLNLLPFSSRFTTLEDKPIGFNPDAVAITFPENGEVTVSAPADSFEPGASVLIVNNGNNSVVSGIVNNDGSFSFKLLAAITDEIQIRITDSQDRDVIINKTEFRRGDGAVAIGKRGGKVVNGDFVLDVPEGALAKGAAIFQLTPLSEDALAALPPPEGGEFTKGDGVDVSTGGAVLEKEAKLTIPRPPEAPDSALYLVGKAVKEGDLTLYEVVDTATRKDDKVTTDSFPFPGVFANGGYVFFYAVPPEAKPFQFPIGVVSGIARETDFSAVDPRTVPLPGIVVRAKDNVATGTWTATTRADGRFTLFSHAFGTNSSKILDLVATDVEKNRTVAATAFESTTLGSLFPNIANFRMIGDVLFNFSISPPPLPPTTISIKLFKGEQEITNGIVETGQELTLRVIFSDSPSQASLAINDQPVVLEKIDGFTFVSKITPPEARSYTAFVQAAVLDPNDLILKPVELKKSFLAVEGGVGNTEPLPGPPSVISDSVIPPKGAQSVSLGQTLSALFTEPVTGITAGSVLLTEKGSSTPIRLSFFGAGPAGPGPVTPSTVVHSLSMVPQQGLKFETDYVLTFTDGIVDTASPAEKLIPASFDFKTFSPGLLGQTTLEEAGLGVATLRDRAFVALPNSGSYGSFGMLAAFDLGDPTKPTRLGADSFTVGNMARSIDAEEGIDFGLGPTDAVAVLSFNPRSFNTGITFFNVAERPSPYPYGAFVSTTLPVPGGGFGFQLDLQDGFAYVASGEAGLQVLDLAIAGDLYRRGKPRNPFDIGFETSRDLFTRGKGFGREAIITTFKPDNGGKRVDVTAVDASGTVGYVTAYYPLGGPAGPASSLSTVRVPSAQSLGLVFLQKDALIMTLPTAVAAADLRDRRLALVVGAGSAGGLLVVVDATDAANPVVLSATVLRGSYGRQVVVDDDGETIYVNGSAGMETYSLADPTAPTFAGMVSSVGADPRSIARTGNLLLSLDGSDLRVTALDVVPLVAQDPAVFVTDDRAKVLQDGRFLLRVVPPQFDVGSAEVAVTGVDPNTGDDVTELIPGAMTDGEGEAPFTKGLVLPDRPRMTAILNRGTSNERRSTPIPIQYQPLLLVTDDKPKLELEHDAVNDTTCFLGAEPLVYFLGLPARVTITVKVGLEKVVFSSVQDPFAVDPDGQDHTERPYTFTFDDLSLFPTISARYPVRIVAELASDPSAKVERETELIVDAKSRIVLPVGRTLVKGVDLLDGHMVASSTDFKVPGRKLGLEAMRTYSSSGSSDDGILGAGWNFNYGANLIATGCFFTIVGGDGSGQRFVKDGAVFKPQKGYHTVLVQNPDGTFDFFTKERVRYHFLDIPKSANESLFGGRLTLEYMEDPNGNRVRVFYDTDRDIKEVREEFAGGIQGRSLFLEYIRVLNDKRVSRITGPMGFEVKYRYDSFANLVQATRGTKPGETRIETYSYSIDNPQDRHNLLSYTDPNGNRTEYVYFKEGDGFPGEPPYPFEQQKFEWVKEVREPENTTTQFVYDLRGRSNQVGMNAEVIDARGNTTKFRLNLLGSPLRVEEPGPRGPVVTTTEWAATDVSKTKETDANGRVIEYEYDANANLTKETVKSKDGKVLSVSSYEYELVFNQMTKKVDAESRVTLSDIDRATGNLESMTDAEGNKTTYEYFDNGDVEVVTGPVSPGGSGQDRITRYTQYDKFGNPERVTDPLGNETRKAYDDRSRMTSMDDDFGRAMSQEFDDLDRLTKTTRTDGKGSSADEVVTRTYYPAGQVRTEENGLGLKRESFLDGLSRVETEDQSGGGLPSTLTVRMEYDGNGNVKATTDRRGVRTDNTYDALNRLIRVEVSGPFGTRQTISEMDYDDAGNKTFETDVHRHRVDFEYDGLYRVVTKKLATTRGVTRDQETYAYDRVGNLLSSKDANGKETTVTYDDLNREKSRTDAASNRMESEYDEAGNRSLEKDVTRGLTTTTEYDPLNRPTRRVVSSAPDVFSYETKLDYDDRAHSVVTTDPRGFKTTTEMDGFDRVHSVSQETGSEILVTTSSYDAIGNVERTVDAEGRETTQTYDGLSRLQRIDYAHRPLFAEFTYDAEGNKIDEVNRRGVITKSQYDNLGRVVRTEVVPAITGVRSVRTVAYDDGQATRIETDARGNPTKYEMDGQERAFRTTDALGETEECVYDGVNKIQEKDKRGHITFVEYDGINRPVKVTDALAQVATTEYKDGARQVVETDKRRLVKTTQLDALGRTVSVTRSGILLERHSFDGNNNRTESKDAKGNVTRFDYDGANRPVGQTEGFGTLDATTTTSKLDRVGNVLEQKDGRVTGKTFDVRNTYDALNRLQTTEDAEGNVTQYEYDGEGNRTAQIEPETNRTEYKYGELNEVIQVTAADGGVFQYTYDPNRNRIAQEDGAGRRVAMEYDELNRMTKLYQDPEGFNYTTTHEYDENGNEKRMVDAKLQETKLEYDELDRLETTIYTLPPSEQDLFFRTRRIDYVEYDGNDNLKQVDEHRSSGNDPPTETTVTSRMEYDTLDRLTKETDTFGRVLQYGYDNQGNRTSLIDPDDTPTTYEYDALNRLERVTSEGRDTTYQYFPDSLKKLVVQPNGTQSSFLYDAADRVTTITHAGASAISSYAYTYFPNSNRKTQEETNAGRPTERTRYTYDLVNRVATITYPDSAVTYTYDKAGNRIREATTGASASDKTFSYDAVNRLSSITDTATSAELSRYTYDANGNTTSKVAGGLETKFLFDIRNQLGEVQQGGSILGRYGYDYDGRRIVKIGAEGRRHYTYDQQSVITEADTSNQTVLKYDYGLDQLVSLRQRGGVRSFYHLDALGSTVNLTTDVGDTQESLFYDAWGRERFRFGLSPNHFTFTGYEADRETKLFYALSRFYDPETGRFLSQDSFLGEAVEPPSLHRYSYASNNPVVFVDPDGNVSVRQAWGIDEPQGFWKALGKNLAYNTWNVVSFGTLARQDTLVEQSEAGLISEDEYYSRTGWNAATGFAQLGLTIATGGAGAGATTATSAFLWGAAGGVAVQGVGDIGEIYGTKTKTLDDVRAWHYGLAAGLGGLGGVAARQGRVAAEALEASNAPKASTIVESKPKINPALQERLQAYKASKAAEGIEGRTSSQFSEFAAAKPELYPGRPSAGFGKYVEAARFKAPSGGAGSATRGDFHGPWRELPQKKVNWKGYLEKTTGTKAPSSMKDPHAHHILPKQGRPEQRALIQEGQDILRRRGGIDPIFGTQNLTWAPNKVPGQHSTATIRRIVETLRALEKEGASPEEFARALARFGKAAAKRR